MRRIYLFFIMLSLAASVYAQNKPAENTDGRQPENNSTKAEKIPDGYGNLTWGMYLSETRDKITGVLTYTDEKSVIVSKDKEMEYYYGFFYKEPSTEIVPPKKDDTAAAADKQTENVPEKDEGRLFYVSINFPYIDKDTVYGKIRAKYGNHTGENVKDNQGAIAWDAENTAVIMWIDNYENKPYCRRIIYISKKLSMELNDYTKTIFNKTEIDLIKKMNP